ncbi:MAG: ATP synthase F1 subunit gamma [Oscillospiraceae bacterium]|nr:ATP synthase F1 subunit gamma [Oscillospiraceae bacterium]
MPSMKFIKRRITSVKNTQQIMKAMNMVAASKLQKAKKRLDTVRPLSLESMRIIKNASLCEGASESVFVTKREVKNTAYVVISGDRGLCGSYNANITKEALASMNEGKNEKIISVGVKSWEFFKRRRKNVMQQRYVGLSDTVYYEDAEHICNYLIRQYIAGEIDEAYIAYTHFETTLSHVPLVVKVLPIEGDPEQTFDNTEFDPDIAAFLEQAVPACLSMFIYGTLAESSVCEQAARMISMDSANHNAEEIIEDLTLMFNRKRQGIITQEINEIVSGANALQ